MKIDWKLFPMKMHYLLRFMGTGPLTAFLPLITRQKGVPESMVGLIWTVLPFCSVVIKISAGTIADFTRGHRAVFLAGITLMMTSLTALYWVPDVPQPCSHPLILTPTPDPGTTIGLDTETSTFVPGLTIPNESLGNNNESSTPVPGSTILRSTLGFDTESSTLVQGLTIPNENLGINNGSSTSVPGSATSRENGTISQEGASSSSCVASGEGESWSLWSHYEFWLLFLCLLGQYCGHVTGITMQETVCFQILGKARHKYGAQRLWGTVGLGLSAMLAGALVSWYSKVVGQQDYLPAHILTTVFLVADLVVIVTLKFPLPERRTGQEGVKYGFVWWRKVMLVLTSTGVGGIACGLLWTFEYILVQDVANAWAVAAGEERFTQLRLLVGLLMGVQAFLAEVPFFLVAGRIITRLGHVNAFFVSLLGFSVRLSLYSAISNPWWFIPADVLHGVSFGILYPAFTAYASSVSPKGAEARTQAIFGATFFFCTGVGGLLGGWLYQWAGGRRTFLLVGAGVGIYALVFFGIHALFARRRSGGVSITTVADNGSKTETYGLKEDEEEGREKKEKKGKKEEEGRKRKRDMKPSPNDALLAEEGTRMMPRDRNVPEDGVS